MWRLVTFLTDGSVAVVVAVILLVVWNQLTCLSVSCFRLFSERNLSMLFTSANQLTQMNMPELQCQEVVEPPATVTVMNWTA